MDAKANAMLIMLNGTQEERAPLEQTQACLTANPNAKVENPATPHAVNLRKHHLMKRLDCGAPSSKGEFAMHPSGDGLWIWLGHKALWAWAYKMSCQDANVTLNVPPESPLFEWQSASSFKPPSKLKFAPASDVTGSPASRIFLPTPQDTPTTSTNLSTNHTESADVSVIGDPPKRRIDKQTEDTDTLSVSASLSTSFKVLRGALASSSIEVLCGFTQYNRRRQAGPSAVPRVSPVVRPVNLEALNHLCIGEPAAKADKTSNLISIADLLDFCGIEADNFHTM
ncbi:hypothetical protein PCASD_03616 [Puccinia coronata f. sp. avenae]|uniref:Uncharacterized protein n=1 Tax=Puccinia coronata f. sp. avenae TaxID=200324 RepID=A0A2N5VDM4_9BASI|nr:hypothetical protein PCASD_03616 [Puccinia coronata f. sp. avenae]